ncbi:receptor-type tyrosine-protein phosphatase eta-like [Xiphias gladius]|uniref:receptor-type tyrosine-protein phosphatase eta-like n=1 Tax=Xiphias gladius TaxID=8245 RepID=UPI001A986A33|nr:receptor-type tyrosine-protein phosphatase eta-like [Xiphias gladius]
MPSISPAECVRTPLLFPDVPETDENYIEDSCVAMLSFGAWVEKKCSEHLPFICYEDEFFGHASVTNVTTSSAVLTRRSGPQGVSHYRVEVTGDKQWTEIDNWTNLTLNLSSLTAGTRYSVQVFPVKCERDLNPQEVTFYTQPNKVKNLNVTNVKETSVSLSWDKPGGNVDFYLTKANGQKIEKNTVGSEVDNLIPGNLYTFTVLVGVEDRSTWSEECSISAYTKPGKVSDLSVSENGETSLLLHWRAPEGNATDFLVKAVDDRNETSISKEVEYRSNQTRQKVTVTGLPAGSRIILGVTALANRTLEGEPVTVVNYTAPGSISALQLNATADSLDATWTPPPGRSLSFAVRLQQDGRDVKTAAGLREPAMRFDQLQTATQYTVVVYSVSGHIRGSAVESSKFTLPRPPTNLRVVSTSKTHIALDWRAPDDIKRANYSVQLHSGFWGQTLSFDVDNETSHTFENLKSGTMYRVQVRTVTPEEQSAPLARSHFTDADEAEISLSMICSSPEPLLCDNDSARETVVNQLRDRFKVMLGDGVAWRLEIQESETTTT